jgi:hypothetical protein
MQTSVDERLDRMIEVAESTGRSLDEIVAQFGRCDQSAFDALSDSPSRLPMYIQSSVTP